MEPDHSEPQGRLPFLSDEWIAAARRLRAEHEGRLGTPAHPVRMNMVVKEVPFGDGTLLAHMDSSAGEPVLDVGHLDTPDVVVSTDYHTAKAIFLDGDPQAGMSAFMAGKVQIQGDMTKLIAALQATYSPSDDDAAAGAELQRRVRDITA